MLPAFFVMLTLTATYASLGVSPIVRGALYGLGPVVLGTFVVAVYRLGRATTSALPQALIAVAAAAAVLATPLGIATILLLAGAAGLLLYHPRRAPGVAVAAAAVALAALAAWWPAREPVSTSSAVTAGGASLWSIAVYFLKVGAFTVGGGLAMIAFIEQQVVEQLHWLTAREFVDGLALGQFTPGPVLMLAAYVGYKVAGVAGAAVAAAAAFLPSFVLMLAVLPLLDRARRLAWTSALMKGMGPAVIGVLAVSLVRLAPHAVVDPVAAVLLVVTVAVLSVSRVGVVRLMLGGSVVGVLRSRIAGVPGLAAVRDVAFRT